MRFIGKVLENVTLLIIVLIITGVLIAQAEHKINSIEMKELGVPVEGKMGIRESLEKTYEYANFSFAIFSRKNGTVIIVKQGDMEARLYNPSPRESFEEAFMTTPEKAILTTFTVLLLTMTLVFLLGLYWGLKAGYQGGQWDKVLSTLAPIFSAIPGWFWAIFLLWTLWWRLDLSTIDYTSYIARAKATGEVSVFTYLNALLLPVLTLTFANVVIYAFNVRTLVRRETHEEHFFADVLKGLPDKRIMKKLLRTVLPSFLTFTSYNFLSLLINAMAVEKLFNVNGIGYVFARSAGKNYYPSPGGEITQTFTFNGRYIFFVALVMVLLYFINSTVMEALYLKLDPRVRRNV
ncbi:ABC transporter permease subunit [Thermococcus camini]|uniref:ABC type dipeptide/oligopeptide/nickel transporter permease 1 n=1 Tax=Thermococcus camini TaxID=2016373 RepID=A0A7G2D5S2_9EURY|nr:ABC transporter permease [Thermococcus camini]CAD5243240.1 ABC type dipeptide/oligopeptide/nickel transporter permease 1 [Thermococcus camini]